MMQGDNSSFHESGLLTVENLADPPLPTKCQQYISTLSFFAHPVILTTKNAILLFKCLLGRAVKLCWRATECSRS